MGDRGNIVVRSENGDVWLYTHWNGSEMKDVLQNVLARKVRWDDAPYLTRMIFSAMVKDNIDGETGFGISTHMCDNNHGILVVDVPNQKVVRMDESSLVDTLRYLPVQLDYRVSRTFEEFAANGFKGKKKQVNRRKGPTERRETLDLGGRRNFMGRRTGDD